MSDEPPLLRLVANNEDVEMDMRGLRMWALETAMQMVKPGPKAMERCLATAETLVNFVIRGDRA